MNLVLLAAVSPSSARQFLGVSRGQNLRFGQERLLTAHEFGLGAPPLGGRFFTR
jgi:hypothetical protein